MLRVPVLLAILLLLLSPAGVAAFPVMVVDGEGEPVADAVIYVNRSTYPEATGHTVADAVITQLDKRFVPHVTALSVGDRVHFTNRDPINHHVYSFSAPKQFSHKLGRNSSDAAVERFDRPGTVVMGCNIHDWMLGYVLVLDTPWYGVTNLLGSVELNWPGELPQQVQVWHPRLPSSPLTLSWTLVDGQPRLRLPSLGPDPRPVAGY